MQRYVRAPQDQQQLTFAPMQAHQQIIKRVVAGALREQSIKARLQGLYFVRAGLPLVLLAAVRKRVKMAVKRGFQLTSGAIGCQQWRKT